MSIGPYRLVQSKTNNNSITGEESFIGDIPPCEYAAHCDKLNDQNHCRSYSHPSLCPFGSECTENADDVHCQSFIHRKKCPEKGQCNNFDPHHLVDYDHPEYCADRGLCSNIKMDHLNLYRHVPICENGIDCDLRYTKVSPHLIQFRHCQRPCQFGGNCIRFHDQKHITNEHHPFNPPCPYTPFSCKIFAKFSQLTDDQRNSKNQNEIKIHCCRYSHICPWGRLCTDKTDEHLSVTIHIDRKICPHGDDCQQKMSEDHLDSYSHPDVRDIRLLCRHPGSECRDRSKLEHIIKYRHNYTLDYLGVTPYFALNKQINFAQNQNEMTEMIRDYVEKKYKQKWKHVSVPNDLLEWIAALQPVHRCIGPIFESILVHGHVMSRSYMEKLEDPKFVADTIDQHKRVRTILAGQVPSLQKNAHEFIEALVRTAFNKGKINSGIGEYSEEALQYRVHVKEETLKINLSKSELDEIRLCTNQITAASIKLHSQMTGIGHKGDLTYGTHKQVFSILGPHTGQYYGDIVIILKRDIMLHPDSNFTMQAATMYAGKTYNCRPWITDSGSESGHVGQFNSTKLHCSNPGYDYVTALELMAITGTQKSTMNVDLSSIIYRWKQIDSHQVIEAHLPQLIPLSYIEHIYIPKNVFESLSSDAQKNARDLFPNNLTITKHVVDLTVDSLAFSKPDDSRKEYEIHVIDQILKSINRQRSILSSSQLLTSYGMTITIPGTNFENCIANPLTITQSYDQYLKQSHRTSKSDDKSIYIYWKALRGDFMIILTNEMIETGKVQPNLDYLTCYIAPFVTNTTSDCNYNERHTYISHTSPTSHNIVLEGEKFKAGSNTFHKGCNPDDYILYCLKLSPAKGQVSLMNAGVNGIYNHTVLKCTFERNELDLTLLDYIHVSAGHHIVSIRNLVISHELIPEAHPKFDKEFVTDTHNTISTPPKANKNHDQRSSDENENENDGSNMVSRMFIRPIKRVLGKIWPGNGQSSEEDETAQTEEHDDEESEDNQQKKHQIPCKDSIYCLDQYSTEKSSSHNQKYSHPCLYSELCQNIQKMPHCMQFTHHKHDVPKCSRDTKCPEVTDPAHRCSYRHTGLSDYLYPCRDQEGCRNTSFDHRKKYFHGEKIKRPPLPSKTDSQPRIPQTKSSNRPQDQFQSHKIHSSQSYHTARESRFQSQSSDEQPSRVWSLDDEESDDEDLVRSFYNDAAGKSNITDATGYDQYGNPTGRIYDLGRDGAYKEFCILIGQFYDFDMQKPIDALKVKGFQVKHVKTENECITELASNRYQIVWIISSSQIQNPSFMSALTAFHSSGGAIFLFADNTPYICHASEFLKPKFGITVEGDYYGGKTLTYKETGHLQTGHFGQHEIFTGITNLYEGITICHPVYSTSTSRTIFTTIATATDGNSCIAVYDPPATSKEGRLCLDCGFTKLYCNWDAAGTARYIVNASCWLLGIEKRLKSKKKNKNK
jgi:hypothetical protein